MREGIISVQGVSVFGVYVHGVSVQGTLSGVSVREVSVIETPIMVEEWAVCILLECILVFDENEPVVSHICDRKELECQHNLGSGTLLLLWY